jgi:hypothetical protein
VDTAIRVLLKGSQGAGALQRAWKLTRGPSSLFYRPNARFVAIGYMFYH